MFFWLAGARCWQNVNVAHCFFLVLLVPIACSMLMLHSVVSVLSIVGLLLRRVAKCCFNVASASSLLSAAAIAVTLILPIDVSVCHYSCSTLAVNCCYNSVPLLPNVIIIFTAQYCQRSAPERETERQTVSVCHYSCSTLAVNCCYYSVPLLPNVIIIFTAQYCQRSAPERETERQTVSVCHYSCSTLAVSCCYNSVPLLPNVFIIFTAQYCQRSAPCCPYLPLRPHLTKH